MPSGIRILQLLLGGLCAALGLVVALEFVLPIVDDVAASGTDKRPTLAEPAPQDGSAAPTALDGAIEEILQRPLFSAARRPPAAKESDDDDAPAPAPSPPPLPDRLAGVMVGPGASEALFGNAGEKQTAVPVGGTIGGWTVSEIELDHVVLTSPFGERVLQPTVATRADLAPQRPRQAAPPVRRAASPTAPPQLQVRPGAQRPPVPPVQLRPGVPAAPPRPGVPVPQAAVRRAPY